MRDYYREIIKIKEALQTEWERQPYHTPKLIKLREKLAAAWKHIHSLTNQEERKSHRKVIDNLKHQMEALLSEKQKSQQKVIDNLSRQLEELKNERDLVAFGATPVKTTPLQKTLPPNHKEKLILIFQYYDEAVVERRGELLTAIHNNLANKHIDEVVIYLEVREGKRPASQLKKDIKIPKGTRVNFLPVDKRMTYEMAIEYGRKHDDGNTIFLLCNNDCYFDDTVDLLKKVNFKDGNRLVCLTRKDLLPNGDIERAKNPPVWRDDYVFDTVTDDQSYGELPYLDYDSADAWAFVPTMKKFKSNYELGTFNCEANFTIQAFIRGIEPRNPCEFIRCIHVHNTYFRRKYAVENETTVSESNKLYVTDDNPRTLENFINGTFRIRSEHNYVDMDSETQEYSDYVVRNFMDICEGDE